MSDRISLIARIGAAIATADAATQAVLNDALTALVEDHALVVADERRKRKDRERKTSVGSKDSADSMENTDSMEAPPSPSPSSSFPTPHITLSSPPPSSPPATRTIRVVQPPPPEVLAVLEHYRTVHTSRRPGEKDKKAIAKALALGFSVADLNAAIDGNAADDWHREKHKHDLPYVLRDSGQIDNFREKALEPAGRLPFTNGSKPSAQEQTAASMRRLFSGEAKL